MKIRQGFVSNSSSSSFIVAVKDSSKIKITVEFDLESCGEVLETFEELIAYMERQYGQTIKEIKDDEYLNKHYVAAKKAIENGKKVIWGSFSNENFDNSAEIYLCDKGLRGLVDENEVEIIESEGGY